MAYGHLREAHSAGEARHSFLVLGIAIGVHEDDRDRVVAVRLGFRQIRAHGGEIGLGLDRSVGEHALGDFDDAGVELLGFDDVAREDLGPRLIPDLERIAKTLGRHQQRALAAPLEQRVCRNRRAHLDEADRVGRDRRAGREREEIADRLHGGVGIGRAFGQ